MGNTHEDADEFKELYLEKLCQSKEGGPVLPRSRTKPLPGPRVFDLDIQTTRQLASFDDNADQATHTRTLTRSRTGCAPKSDLPGELCQAVRKSFRARQQTAFF